MQMRKLLALPLFLAFLCTQVSAQNNFDLDDLEDGQIMLNLNATEQTEVDQDTLNANLLITSQGRDRVALQNEVNTAMAKALELLKDSGNVEYSTQQYHVYPVQAGNPSRRDVENPVWRASQSIQLKSQDSGALLELAGALQSQGFTLNNLNYSLSSARYEEVSDSLMTAALMQLQNRADQTAKALGKSRAELIEISLNGNQNMPYYVTGARAMAMDAEASFSAPVAEPGKSTVSLTVSARALVSP